jgi:hypothetical protein
MITTLPPAVTAHVAVGGSCRIALAKHRCENRMTPVLTYRGVTGTEHTVELSTGDVVSLMESLVTLFAADQPQVTEWWRELTGHR